MANRLARLLIAVIPLVVLSACSSKPVIQQARQEPARPQSGDMSPSLDVETLQAFPDYESELPYRSSSSSDEFPRPRELEPQIRFWHKTYAGWSRSQVAIHDKRHMGVIYEVFQLPGYVGENLTPGQKDFIQERMSFWRNRLHDVEDRLSAGARLGPDERRLADQIARAAGDRSAVYGAGDRLRYQRGLRERFRRGLAIGSQYDRRFRQIFRNAGLPEDLAYLPHVESSFQANAHSSAGALGIWQFTAGAARIFMNGDDSMAARLDPIASTYGAARYLGSAYDKLGSWPLAITSYNHGIGGMQRARSRFGVDFPSIVKHYDSPQFGFASRNYYAEFLAARDIARDPERFFPEGGGDDGAAVWANAGMLIDNFAPETVETASPVASGFVEVSGEAPVETASSPPDLQPVAAAPTELSAALEPEPEEPDSVSSISAPQEIQFLADAANQTEEIEPAELTQEESSPLSDFPALRLPQHSGSASAPPALQAPIEVQSDLEEVVEDESGQSGAPPAMPAPKPRAPEPPTKATKAARVETAKAPTSAPLPASKSEAKKTPALAPPKSSTAQPQKAQKAPALAQKSSAKVNSAQAAASAPKKAASNAAAKPGKTDPKSTKIASGLKEKPAKPASGSAQAPAQPKTASRPAEAKSAAKNTPHPVTVGYRTERPAAQAQSKPAADPPRTEKAAPKNRSK